MSPIPDALPAGLVAYGRSMEFTPETLPARFKAAHSTKAGTWGLLHVLEGKLLYRLEPPQSDERVAVAGARIVIEPGVLHRVAFVEPGRFYVEFYRAADSSA